MATNYVFNKYSKKWTNPSYESETKIVTFFF